MQVSVVFLFALVAVASAQFAQQQVRKPVPIIGHQHILDDFGQFSVGYETGDGAFHTDQGSLKKINDDYVLVRQGSHSYTSPEGRFVKLSYTADENGYHPVAEHLPVPPVAIV